MTSLMMLLMMQYVISTRAGLVNYVEGEVNVKATQSIQAGAPVKTGANGYAEILLNPGSFLWIGSNSEIVLDSVQLTAIAVRVVSGAAMIEASSSVSKKIPIKVTTQDLTTDIVDDGLYLFSDGTARVLTGKLRTANSKNLFKKGWRVALTDNAFHAGKVSKNSPASPVELWSRGRSERIAQANRETSNTLGFRSAMLSNIWLFNPLLGFYTFMPSHPYRSPYGYRYYSVAPDYGNYNSYGNSGGSAAGGLAGSGGSSSGVGSSGAGTFGGVSDQPSNREVIMERKSTVFESSPPPGQP